MNTEDIMRDLDYELACAAKRMRAIGATNVSAWLLSQVHAAVQIENDPIALAEMLVQVKSLGRKEVSK